MSTTTERLPAHPVVDFAIRARERLDRLSGPGSRPVWAMQPEELRQALAELAVVDNQLAALRLEVLAEAERAGACTDEGDRTAADWLARTARQRRRHARADLHLARSLDGDCPQVRGALREGRVNVDQARAIVRSLEALPRSGEEVLSPEQRCSAETFLVEQAEHHDAAALAVLGRRLHEVVAPEEADAREGRALEAQERRAAERVSLELREDQDGVCHGRFRLPALHGAMLTKMLGALMSPARPGVETGGPPPTVQRPLPVRRGEAFAELIESLSARALPTASGGDATVVVTMTLEQLLGRLDDAGVATLDTGHRLSAGEARRLAARHRLVPMVLGGASTVLDLGRESRLFDRRQRLALGVTQGGCTAEHCDMPPALCHAHHDQPFSRGGPTDLANARLLCPHHHRRVHDPAYESRPLPSGKVAFHRRT